MTIPIGGNGGLPLFEARGSMEGGFAQPPSGDGETSFDDVFGKALAAHSAKAQHATELAESFAAGATEDIHGTMIAIKEVEIELHVISNVRRKMVDAFQELWRMNI